MESIKRKVLQGVLVVNKPYGMVSKDVSRWIQKRFGKQKLGHVGTLDPLASGVLPIVFGKATKLQDYLLDIEKSYEFDLKFGEATLTLDIEGEVYEQMPFDHVSEEKVALICSDLVGPFMQTPPIYSAVKYEGKPLYEYARSGKGDDVPLDKLKKVVGIKSLELKSFKRGLATFSITCTKGTYVRVVAHTIARKLGTCGHVARLVRTSAAGFSIEEAVSLEVIDSNLDCIEEHLKEANTISLNMPIWLSPDEETARRLKLGQKMNVDMRSFEDGLESRGDRRATIHSIDRILLLDKDRKSFGIGSACVLNTGRMAVQMRRGLS